MRRIFGILTLLSLSSPASAALVNIDSSLFTIASDGVAANWTQNTLTLDFSNTGPLFGGFVQTAILPTTNLPSDIIGIAFDISSTLENPRISFGYLAYDNTLHGQGSVDLVNYAGGDAGFPWTLGTFTRIVTGLGFPTSTSQDSSLGANYSPFPLVDGNHSSPFSYPKFSLDFRADGYNTQGYLPGSVTFANIQWITSDASPPSEGGTVPEPASLAIWGMGALAFAVGTIRRRFARVRSRLV